MTFGLTPGSQRRRKRMRPSEVRSRSCGPPNLLRRSATSSAVIEVQGWDRGTHEPARSDPPELRPRSVLIHIRSVRRKPQRVSPWNCPRPARGGGPSVCWMPSAQDPNFLSNPHPEQMAKWLVFAIRTDCVRKGRLSLRMVRRSDPICRSARPLSRRDHPPPTGSRVVGGRRRAKGPWRPIGPPRLYGPLCGIRPAHSSRRSELCCSSARLS